MRATQVVLAILLVGDRYVLQLRDDDPSIEAPGMWGLFGGEVELDETPAAALVREIREELSVEVSRCRFLWSVQELGSDPERPRTFWFFEVPFAEFWGTERLTEGKAARCFSFEDLTDVAVPVVARRALTWHRFGRGDSTAVPS